MTRRATQAPALPAPVVDAAIDWLVHLWSGNATDDSRAAWQRWRAQDPLHERAWRHIEATDARFREHRPAGLNGQVAVASLATRPRAAGRRQALRGLGWLAVTGTAAWSGYEHLPWRGWSADVHTAKGEQRPLQLPDGTRLLLNTATALDVRYSAELRRLRLLEGELLITTAYDAASRPFMVDTPAGRVQALGTRFTVRHDTDGPDAAWTRVAVLEGAVRLRSASGDASLRIGAGESARMARLGRIEPQATAPEPSWSEGVLVASDMRLDDFVAELRRYRPGVITLAPEVAGLRLSGVFPLADTDRILHSLVQVLPVDVRVPVRHWVRIGPAAAGA